ncbi:MAG: Gfo/Idh/MocA family oxidoreductase [Clostridia bacterium]|nr:Gfo/Idh/MocA family oxidoreductase [Clostridia bacterium]
MKPVKLGIFGLSRGISLLRNAILNKADVVALCDMNSKRLEDVKANSGLDTVATYTDFDSFIEHEGMEAVIICNFFHEHAKYAIKALEKNIHVLSECLSNVTMAEGVALVRAAEKSNAIYMLEENYLFTSFNREIKRICDGGTLGRILFAEGEYNHPFWPQESVLYKPYAYHWRNMIPATYYVTHSLAPLMLFTGATPKRVTAMPVYAEYGKKDGTNGIFHHDRAAAITTLNDDDSVFRFTGWAQFGGDGEHYRVCGTKGQIENVMGTDGKIMLRYNRWQKPDGMEDTNFYKPIIEDEDKEFLEQAGHDGGDFITIREFIGSIRENRRPIFDVYSATACASVAILAHRSQMGNGIPMDIPDFRLEDDKKKFENDNLSPFYGSDGSEPTVRCSSRPVDIDFDKIDNYQKTLDEITKEYGLIDILQ